ncbi:DUF4352 domain-containing protein [Streptomyces griseorubiginosus]|uniref:DUF4352 domain-containing protein n=1 Tax=Streptomyces griseorubiginosus TaxID=67304 RepID=UPI0036EB6FE8
MAALPLAVLIVTAVAACGEKQVSTTPASSAPEHRTTATQQSTPTASPSPSVASVGDTLTLTGDESEKVAVTVVKVVDPAAGKDEFSSPDSGKRFVAVQFRLKNVGSKVFDDAPDNDAKVKDEQGQQFDPSLLETSAGPGFGGSVTLPSGDSGLGFINFEVPATARITKIQFTLNSGFANDVGQWNVP